MTQRLSLTPIIRVDHVKGQEVFVGTFREWPGLSSLALSAEQALNDLKVNMQVVARHLDGLEYTVGEVELISESTDSSAPAY